jgi:copper resistance protein B
MRRLVKFCVAAFFAVTVLSAIAQNHQHQATEPAPTQGAVDHSQHAMPNQADASGSSDEPEVHEHTDSSAMPTAVDHSQHDMPAQTSGSDLSADGMVHDHDAAEGATVSDSAHAGHEMPVEPAATMVNHEAMDHSGHEQMATGGLRDPHANSNGYTRTTGPYSTEGIRQLSLADEAVFRGLWVDRFEYVDSHDFDATEFEGHLWMGDSYNRYLLRSEIEIVDDSLHTAEVDLLHTRAISPFWDLRFGVRREFGEEDDRNWASIGLGGLAPGWFEVDASLFFGEGGNSLLDIEIEYDLLLTQRLVMQPRLDIHSYGKTDKEMGRGSGLSIVKTGFRLRYEFDRQFAPYLGYERVVKYGKTADLLTVDQDRTDNHWVLGLKVWF